MSERVLYLYTSLGCHLCEQAEALLRALPAGACSEIRAEEIGDSDDLIARYGIRIPVVAYSSEQGEWRELGWPFDAAMLAELLGKE